MIAFQCPSCWADPWCPDCMGVIALGVFWLIAYAVFALIIWRNSKDLKPKDRKK